MRIKIMLFVKNRFAFVTFVLDTWSMWHGPSSFLTGLEYFARADFCFGLGSGVFDVCRGFGHMPIGRFLHEWPFTLCWKNDLPGSKAVTVLGREVTNICICAFKVGSFGSLLSRSFFQLTWLTAGERVQESANRHMTDSTENVIQNNFYRFFRGFQWSC